ncbi:MAG TPA: hypothetical protein VFM34_00140 [Moraxellaceae bacterium]|nr:hypothetical protein [Moraxellaceae bacterium]
MSKERELTVDIRYGRPHLKLRDAKHVRHTEVYHSGAIAILEVVDYDGSRSSPEAWTSIELREITTDKRGRETARVISVTLRPDERAALIKLLNGE